MIREREGLLAAVRETAGTNRVIDREERERETKGKEVMMLMVVIMMLKTIGRK